MFNFITKNKDLGLLILRLGLGATLIFVHGWPKLAGGEARWISLGGAMANLGITFFPAFWGFMSGFVEFVGGFSLILGLKMRAVCVLLAFNMLVATVSLASKQGGAMGTAYPFEILVVFIALFFVGAGKYSLDKD